MAKLNVQKARDLLQSFNFGKLFVEELGWSQPTSHQPTYFGHKDDEFLRQQIAQLSGVVVLEITTSDGKVPDRKTLAAIHKEISKLHHENLLIFVDAQRTQSLWYWVKREDGKLRPREHPYFKGQPGDLFLSKLSSMVFDITEFDEAGNVAIVEVANRLKQALDVERVTKRFYNEYQEEHLAFLELIKGINDEKQRRWYASVLLNRLMFIYFLQRKGFVNDDYDYLQNKLAASRKSGANRYYADFLTELFFVGFAKPDNDAEKKAAKHVLGDAPYLNGGLFLQHKIETDNPNIQIPDKAFDNIYKLFARYSWNLDDTPGGQSDEISPHVLGYIFEKYINQKSFGAYYTRPEITQYLCEQTIYQLILDRVNFITAPDDGQDQKAGSSKLTELQPKGSFKERRYDSMPDLLMNLDSWLCRFLLDDVLPSLKLLDPACGSGAFLVAAMRTLINVYSAITGKIEFLGDASLKARLEKMRREHHGSVDYFIKKRIITNNLFGVDIMEEGTDIAKLRLFLALVASAKTREQLEPLPNIDFNILTGNSLIGLMHVDDKEFDKRNAQGNLFLKSYRDLVRETANDIRVYRGAAEYNKDLRQLRDNIETKKREVATTLNEILLTNFTQLGIKFQQTSWDEKKGKDGKPVKRAVRLTDLRTLNPFHWGFEFDEVLNKNGGFDAVITNPPWEVFQTYEKEFFQSYAPSIQKKNLRIEDWEAQRNKLMKDPEIQQDWNNYSSRFSYQLAYFKQASQYANQTTLVDGKVLGNKPNLYGLFTEQCFNLLRPHGLCGIVLPSGIYTDLSTKQLRVMLFDRSQITGLFSFENRKEVFEGVHRSFKFAVLTFRKGGQTVEFPAAFMRHDVGELERFPKFGALPMSVELIRRLSPDSISVPEFKREEDISIATKLLDCPLLSEPNTGWGLELYGEELNMTRSAKYFQTSKNKCPLYEGGMIWHFDSRYDNPRYWVKEPALRRVFLEKRAKRIESLLQVPSDMKNDYEVYRLAIRKIASNTNERTLVSAAIPPYAFAGHSLSVNFPFYQDKNRYNELRISNPELLALVSLLNSFVADYALRYRMTTNLSLYYLYQLPIPRIFASDPLFKSIVEHSAKLTCTTSEFDDLAREVGLRDHRDGVTDPVERARLRAELDGIIAHLYGLTEEEFTHILSTFPLIEQSVKDAALDAYREFAPKPGDQEIVALIAKGESTTLEFKSSARWDMKQNKADKLIEGIVVKTVAALLNSEGGALLLGVDDDRNVIGLAHDYKLFGKKDSRDAYENFLTTLLLQNLGKDSSTLISITFHELDAKDIAKVAVKPSPKPVYDKDGLLYIRAGNSTRPLNPKETVDYCKMHWTT